MDTKIIEKYRKYRRDHPFTPAKYALSWAKSPDASEGWEEDSHYADPVWKQEVDGFTVKLTVEDESIFPMPNKRGETDYGNYVDEVRRDDYDWEGNYPRPVELPEVVIFEPRNDGRDRHRSLCFPYTSIRYDGPGWVQGERGGYFIPDGIKDEFEMYRRYGQSRSVAWDLTRQFIEDQVTMLFHSPLTNCVVCVKVYKNDIELGSTCMGTDVSGDDEGRAYIFEMVKEHGMIEEAIEEAKTAIVKLVED